MKWSKQIKDGGNIMSAKEKNKSGSSANIRINGNNICKSIDKCTFKIYEHGFLRKNL